MNGGDLFKVLPTPTAKQEMVARQLKCQKAFDILETKVLLLERRLKDCAKDIIATKRLISNLFKELFMMAAETRNVVSDLNKTILNTVSEPRLKVFSQMQNIFGIKLKNFESRIVGQDQFSLLGLAKGGAKVDFLKQAFANAIDTLVKLAGLQITFIILQSEIKNTKCKKNGLKFVIIPKLERTIQYIDNELKERERDDYCRMKLIKKLQNKKIEEKEKKEKHTYYGGGDFNFTKI